MKGRRVEQEMEAELRSHVRLRAAALEAEGVPGPEAARRARLEFGSGERWREECREALGGRLLFELRADLRQGWRQLRRHRGFTAVAVLTLALGIGANTAMFSMVEGMLLRALPYRQPRELYVIHEAVPQWSNFGTAFAVNAANFNLWRQRCPAFAGMTEFIADNLVLSGRGEPEQVRVARVGINFFPVLGVAPRLGRGLDAAHGREALLSDRLWRREFHADPSAIGQALALNGAAYTVVGILPPSFRFPSVWGGREPAVYLPVALGGADLHPGIGNFRYSVIARLAPGATATQALAQLNAVEWDIAHRRDSLRHVAAGQYDLYATLTPLKEAILGPAARALWILWAAAALLLLIVCFDLTNLLLAKNADRAHEVALRAALGASTARLLRQFLTEAGLLTAAGGVLGWVLAAGALQLLLRNVPAGLTRVDNVHLDGAVMLFTFGIAALAALLFALLPVLLLARAQPLDALQAAGPRFSAGRVRGLWRDGLVVAEVAVCAVLLSGALLLAQSFSRLGQANQWMRQPHVLALGLISPPLHAQAELVRFYDSVLERVQRLPGVEAAAFTPVLPLGGGSWGDNLDFQEARLPPARQPIADFYFISPGFTRAIGLPVLRGRALSPGDRDKNVVLISESVARKLLPGRNPLGAHLLWSPNEAPAPRAVVGVVADMRDAAHGAPALAVYVPLWTFAEPDEHLIIRSTLDPASLVAAVRPAIWGVDARVAFTSQQTLPQVLAASTAPSRYEATLAAVFAALALLIAALGLYGVVSYAVSQRVHEIGIRLALGARRGDLLRSVAAQSLGLAVLGAALGLAAALVLTRSLSSLLYGIHPGDLLTSLAVALVLLAVAAAASYVPARRATRVDPSVALRSE